MAAATLSESLAKCHRLVDYQITVIGTLPQKDWTQTKVWGDDRIVDESRVPKTVHFMPQPDANSVVAILRGIGSPELPCQNQNPEKSFESLVDDTLNLRQERKAMTTFKATTEGTDKLGIRAVLERYANDQWLSDYYTEEQRVGIVFEPRHKALQQLQ